MLLTKPSILSVFQLFTQATSATVIQKPRYLLASVLLWGVFVCLKLLDDYDGIMSWISAPFVATLLLAISLPITLVLGLSRKIPWIARMWYSGRMPATFVLTASILILVFGHSLAMQESYIYTNSLGDAVTATRLRCLRSFWRRSQCSTGLSEGNYTRLMNASTDPTRRNKMLVATARSCLSCQRSLALAVATA